MTTDAPFSVEGRRAAVTGGAMGIGFGIVERLAAGGAHVLLVDLDRDAADAAASKLQGLPGRVVPFAADVSAEGAGERVVSACVDAFGGIDVLVNNAGIYPTSSALTMTPSFFDRVLDVNVRGTVFLAQAAANRMIADGVHGAIVNIGSIDSLHPSMVGLAAYDTSKGAVLMFTRALALELGPHGIRVNAVAPGGIATEGASKPLQGSGMTEAEMEAMIAGFTARVPLGRMGQPDDIAKVVLFLASDAASYVTGELLVVDGGRLLS